MISEREHSIARIKTTSINIMDIVRIFMGHSLLFPLTLKSKRRLPREANPPTKLRISCIAPSSRLGCTENVDSALSGI